MEIEFNANGNKKQLIAAKCWSDDSTENIVYGGSKGSGKSYLGGSMVFGDALIYPNTFYFIARKKLNDLRRFTIPTIHEVLENWKIDQKYYKYNGQDNVFDLYNKSKVFLLDAKYLPSDPLYQRFGSMQMTRGWIEEAGEFEKECKTNLFISTGRKNNLRYGLKRKLLETCNPSKNYLYPDFYIANKNGELKDWEEFIQALPYDNKMLGAGYIEGLERTLVGAQRQRLLLGNWEYDDDPSSLIEYDAILDLFRNTHVPKEDGQRFITADIAMQGSDSLRIIVWFGWVAVAKKVLAKSDGEQVINAIEELRKKYRVRASNIAYDADGVGSFVGGFIRGAKAFKNGSRALLDENYENLKTQCYYRYAELVMEGGIWISFDCSEQDRKEIIEEHEQIKSRDADKDGKLKLIRKEEVKRNISRSPDWTDALMMRVIFELRPKSKGQRQVIKL